ncbi:thiol reductant ABC exporter subunit CydD [Nocardioides sp. 616]|uniref:thiol reductant ABC exporter subunit CydD n=1 Tax=Nocardioides sp. 616 TaxID=2268090 RepID=UPI000CE46E2D|nr:thiol reductant ABC exporter subunit CydD [Nocardioides sp. 616]
MKPVDPALLPHLLPARRPLALGLAASITVGLLAVAQAVAAGLLVVRLVTDPGAGQWHGPALVLAVVVALRAGAGYVVDVSGARAATLVSTALRRRLLAAAAAMDPWELSRHRTGELAALATRGTAAVEPYLTRYLPSLVLAAVLPVTTVAAIFALDWLAGLIVVATLPLVPVFAILIGLSTRDRAARQWRELATLSGHFLDVVRGLPTLVAHRRATAQSASIRGITDRYRRATLDTLRIAFASSAALELLATISVALVAVTVGLRLASGGIDFETALIVLLLAPEAYWPWRRVGAEFHSAAEGTATFEAANELLLRSGTALSAVTGSGDSPAAGPEASPLGRPVHLELDRVGFTYPDRRQPALDPVSARLPATGLVAVTGASGAGKSTLLAVLSGELAPSLGTVRVNGRDLADLSREVWRATLATAPQRPWLSAGTVAENLRVAHPGADDAQLWHALEAVDLGEVVAGLEAGLGTPLGEDGAGLSAGQRARLALARVVLADRPVMLLDEPSAHLDAATEAVLLDTLRSLARTALVIVVAHRDQVAAAADLVLTLRAPACLPPADPVPTAVVAEPRAVVAEPRAVVAEPRATAAQKAPIDVAPARRARFDSRTATALGALSVASGVALTATAAWLITRASEHPPVLMLMVAIVGVRTFGLARPVLRYAERLVSHDAALRMLAERRASVYDALVPLVPGRLGVRRGDLLTSVVDDVDALVDEELRVRQPLQTSALVGATAIVLAALVAPLAGLVTAAICAVAWLAHLVTRRRVAVAEPAFVAARAEVSTRVEHILASLRQLELWQATTSELDGLAAAGGRLGGAAQRSVRATAAARAVTTLACGAGLVLMAAGLSGPLGRGELSPAMTALLVMLPLALEDALSPLADAAAVAVRTRAARARLDALTAQPPAVAPDAPGAARDLGHPRLELREVRAGWGDRPVVEVAQLDLPVGGRIGLVGPSGSGKSTVAALLLRFLDPASGAVLVDGTDARALRGDDVRARVGLVDDDPHVFGSTVAENVRLARPDAGDAEVADALVRAHLGPWLAELPHGLDTMVGDGHAHVSGGERARLAVARSLLADQPVLILDEPTAHLDAETAQAVTDELLGQPSRSILWITHGVVGLDAMDQVVRLGAREAVAPGATSRVPTAV